MHVYCVSRESWEFQEIRITMVLIQEGTSYVQRTSTGKLRMSAARAFLKPACANGKIFT